MPTLTTARRNYVAFALSTVGWTKPDPRLGQLVAPGDDPAQELAIEDESLCMLVALGHQDAVFGVPVRGPYVNGSAPRLLHGRCSNFAGIEVALKVPDFDNPPQPGDVAWYGKSSIAPEHTEACADAQFTQDGTQAEATCVAGGERVSGPTSPETIRHVMRTWEWSEALKLWVDHGTGRPIMYVIDCDAMAALHGLR